MRKLIVKGLLNLAAWLSEPQVWHDSLVDGEQSIDVRCPYCEREKGQPCRRSRPDKRPHLERRLAALNQLEMHQ
jgi:hypothetical protein